MHGVPKGIIVEREYQWMDEAAPKLSDVCGGRARSPTQTEAGRGRKQSIVAGIVGGIMRRLSVEAPGQGGAGTGKGEGGGNGSTLTFRKTRKPAIRRGESRKANARRFSLAGW